MATANTSYGGGGMSTVTDVGGYDSGNNDMIDFWNQMARRRRQAINAASAVAPRSPFGARTVRAPQMAPGAEGSSLGGLKERLIRAQLGKAAAESHALSGRVPTRMATVGGQTFATPDALAMSGAQRHVFLPSESSFQNAPSSGGFGAGPKVYGGPGSDFEDSADEDAYWKMQAIKAQAAANAKK